VAAPSTNQRIAIVIQYLGKNFNGWQRQAQGRTVQEEIEKVIANIVGKPVNVIAAGRTDAGVHAAAQFAHFDVTTLIPPAKWATVLNSYLPKDILILGSAAVKSDWHARFSASWRRYRYTIYTNKQPNLFIKDLTWHYYQDHLDETLMQNALTPLLGNHHLSAFQRANSKRKHSWVDVQAAECYREGSFIHIELQANGFLYGMVRLIVGMLVEVGIKARSPENFTEVWTKEQRQEVKYSAPAKGLCLLRVGYPEMPFKEDIWWDTLPKFLFQQPINE
jgi:tRNA pseudouridine38-40 synthase